MTERERERERERGVSFFGFVLAFYARARFYHARTERETERKEISA